MRQWLPLVFLWLFGGAAQADDAPPPSSPPAAPDPKAEPAPPLTPRRAAQAVLAARKAKDDAALMALASQDDPEPWQVADELIRRGEFDAAEAFARAAPRPDVERLPAYIASRRGRPDHREGRAKGVAASAALARDEPLKALDALGPAAPGPLEDLTGVRLQSIRGRALSLVGRHEEAAAALLSAAEAAERIGWLPAASLAYSDRAEMLTEFGTPAAAREAWARALAISERRRDRSGEFPALRQLGHVHQRLGEGPKALEYLERAREILEQGGDPAELAGTLIDIGNVRVVLGDYPKALESLRRGLEGAEAAGEREFVAIALNGLSDVYAHVGDFAKAIAMSERALEVYEALDQRDGVASTLDRMGSIHDLLGDYRKALASYERALAAMEALGNRAGVATALTNIGIVRMRLGDHEKAIEAQERALAAFESLGDRAAAVAARVNLGAAYKVAGDLEKALASFERGARDAETLGHRQWTVNALDGLRDVRVARGDFAKALELSDRELAMREELGDRMGQIGTLRGVARARTGLKDWSGAAAAARRAASLLPQVVAGLADEQGATARAQFADVFEVGARAAAEARDADAVFGFLESGRAGSLLEALGSRTALQAALVPPALAADEARAHAQETSALGAFRQALDAGDIATSRARRRELDGARAAVEAAVERIQREAKAAANVVQFAPDDLAAIRERLGPDEALVTYGLYDEGSLAFVATRGGAATVKLPATETIQAACEALLTAIDEGKAAGNAGASTDAVNTAVEALREFVVKPLGLASGTSRLLISPDGELSYVPFTLLAPDREVAYVTSGTTYGLLLRDAKARGEGVLALGDPDYESQGGAQGGEAGNRGGGAGALARLPATAREVKAIGDTVLLQKEATEKGLREAVAKRPRWRTVHFACHGLINAERPSFSSLALTAAGEDDGFLTVGEVFRSKIPADLVVLSACETGRGKVVRGEGIMGLTRAFMFAGSPRVICSLWKVDDTATQALMTRFYELWSPKTGEPGLPTAEALRKAQEFVRSQEQWKHPYYWAAWVLWGVPG